MFAIVHNNLNSFPTTHLQSLPWRGRDGRTPGAVGQPVEPDWGAPGSVRPCIRSRKWRHNWGRYQMSTSVLHNHTHTQIHLPAHTHTHKHSLSHTGHCPVHRVHICLLKHQKVPSSRYMFWWVESPAWQSTLVPDYLSVLSLHPSM